MMNYEEMSDFEVNGYVSMYMHGFSWIEFDDGFHCHVKCGNEHSPGFAMIEVADYCGNPSDAWPIILDNHISVINDYGWGAYHRRYGIESSMHVNPLRAAMIVFLIMQESK